MKNIKDIAESIDAEFFEDILRGYVAQFIHLLKTWLIFIPAAVVFFVCIALGVNVIGGDNGFRIGGVSGFVLSLVTMYGLSKLLFN